jgi:hypothetical protein
VVKAGAPTFGEVYHICAAERCTLPELLELMALHSPRCAPAAAAGRCIVLGAAQAAQLSAEEKALLGSAARPSSVRRRRAHGQVCGAGSHG